MAAARYGGRYRENHGTMATPDIEVQAWTLGNFTSVFYMR